MQGTPKLKLDEILSEKEKVSFGIFPPIKTSCFVLAQNATLHAYLSKLSARQKDGLSLVASI
jgi:hypothetical protein